MKIRPPLIAAMLALGTYCKAQTASPDVIASTGNCFTTPDVSLSWTMGEVVSETDAYSNGYLTQGFQQPTSIVITSVDNVSSTGNVSAYPNPFTSSFNVKNNDGGKALQLQLTDMTGKVIVTKNMSAGEQEFNMDNYANGIYFLRVYDTNNTLVQTLKVDKTK